MGQLRHPLFLMGWYAPAEEYNSLIMFTGSEKDSIIIVAEI
jgi:hypothetical protein